MALTRGFSPAQFRGAFLGVVGPVAVTPSFTSVTSGTFAKSAGLSCPGAQVGDIVLVIGLATSVAGVTFDGQVSAANTIELDVFNISGSAYTNTTLPVTVLLLRAKTA